MLVDQLSDQGGSVLVRARVPVHMIKVGGCEENIAIMTLMVPSNEENIDDKIP